MSSVPSHRPNDSSPSRDSSFLSYSRAVKKNLFALPVGKSPIATGMKPVTHKRVWLRSSEEFTIFFDTAPIKCSPGVFHRAMRAQFPIGVGLGIHTRREQGRVFYEIALSTKHACDTACDQGVTIEGTLHTPFRGLPADKEVLTVYLKKIPMVDEATLTQQLKTSLGRFGEVSELILYHESNGNWFNGEGLAVLYNYHPDSLGAKEDSQGDRQGADLIPVSEFEPLMHKIDFDGTRTYYATWKSMPLTCRYCHEDGHSRGDCPERQKSLRCYGCGSFGHIRLQCPKNLGPLPEPPRSVPLPTSQVSSSIPTSSTMEVSDVLECTVVPIDPPVTEQPVPVPINLVDDDVVEVEDFQEISDAAALLDAAPVPESQSAAPSPPETDSTTEDTPTTPIPAVVPTSGTDASRWADSIPSPTPLVGSVASTTRTLRLRPISSLGGSHTPTLTPQASTGDKRKKNRSQPLRVVSSRSTKTVSAIRPQRQSDSSSSEDSAPQSPSHQ
jgi:hypothetical protein